MLAACFKNVGWVFKRSTLPLVETRAARMTVEVEASDVQTVVSFIFEVYLSGKFQAM